MSSDVTAAAEHIRLHPQSTQGPWLVGGLVEVFLMGVLLAMVIDYRARYSATDSWRVKAAVYASVVLNTIRTLQTIAAVWHKLVANFGDYISAATSSPWYTQLDPLTTVLTCLLVQAFFAARLHRLTGGLRWLFVLLLPAMALALAGHVAVTVQIHHTGSVDSLAKFNKDMYVALCGLIAADVITTASLSYILWRSKTGIRGTDSLILRLLHITWVTAALPCISELLNLVVYLADVGTGNSTFIIFHLLGPKLYSLSMMYTLNVRQGLRDRDNSIPLSTLGALPDAVRAASVKFNDPDAPEQGSRVSLAKVPPVA